MEVLKQYKGTRPMYDLNETLKEQMSLPLEVTFSDLKSQVREVCSASSSRVQCQLLTCSNTL